MRRAALAALAALAAPAAAAQEGGPIRTGEHGAFTRMVMAVEPTTEWSLETGGGEAVVFFPGRRIEFGLRDVFARIPRTRVTRIETDVTDEGTRVAVSLACDCRISASFVDGRFLALDVSDRDAPLNAAERAAAAEDPGARAAREAETVASAEEALVEQIARAADQGVVMLSPAPEEAAAAAAPAPAPPPAPEPQPDPEPVPAPTPAPEAESPPAPEAESLPTPAAEEPASSAAEALAELALEAQIEAITVYDRDGAARAARAAPPEPPAPCVADADLDVGRWTDGSPMRLQTPALMRRVVGEFDRPDPAAVRDLARLYVRFGFGAEAETLLAQFDADLPDGPLLADLARTVEGRPVAADGPLALPLACQGRHGLWLAAGGAAPAFHDAAHFGTVQTAFADLPADLRALVGPGLVTRLLEAGRPAEARLIQVTAIRPGVPPTPELQLSEARLLAAEGKADEAVALLRPLAESNATGAVDALALRTRIALDAGLTPPERVLTDLRGAALQQRGDAREGRLRGLIAETLARRGALAAALTEVRAAQADLPAERDAFTALALALLGAADPDAVGAGAYAAAVLAAGDLLPAGSEADPARRAVAERLVALGLPNGALDLLAPPLGRADPESRRLAARAHLALDEAPAALAALEGLGDAEAVALRAAALAGSGAPAEALAVLDAAGAGEAALPYAWPSGAWTRARAATDDPARAAMAGFMAAREAVGPPAPPPADPEALSPEAAFQAALPPLEEPSLGASRGLLAAGRQVGGFLQGVLAAE